MCDVTVQATAAEIPFKEKSGHYSERKGLRDAPTFMANAGRSTYRSTI